MELILASASARREELMRRCGYDFTVVAGNADEHIDCKDPAELVERLALRKAREVYDKLGGNAVVVGADTVVSLDSCVIGKPVDQQEAEAILAKESGRTHTVYTGVAVVSDRGLNVAHSATDVTFANITQSEIKSYVQTGEPMDKAGAYGIQGRFSVFIERINGDYFTVMGLPMYLLYGMLKREGIVPAGFE